MTIKHTFIAVSTLTVTATALAERFGNLDSELSDDAVVCMSVGTYASVSGLDDMTLTPLGSDGAAGASYEGTDTFHVQSNSGVRIIVTGESLSNGRDTIRTYYFIDNQLGGTTTPADLAHDGNHQIKAVAQLNNISSQQSGTYTTEVTVTVSPLLGGNSGCGESQTSLPLDENEQWAFMAFEDLYPNPGDADYNDFVMAFHATESYDADGGLDTINLSFAPLARGTDYNHSIWLDLDGIIDRGHTHITTETAPLYQGDAIVKVSYTDLENGTIHSQYFDKDDDIPIFHSTRAALDGFANVDSYAPISFPKWKTDIEITLADSVNTLLERGLPDESSYRVYMHVNNTNEDIDLAAVNAEDGMIDSNGFPFGLVVPGGWQWPLERVHIDQAYQHFDDYRAWLSDPAGTPGFEAQNWFSSPDTSGLVYPEENIATLLDFIESTEN
ncbi:hypothetical protein GCM10023116_33180 [Kistimonas scapharcae]|uniref:DUF4842 domain-containing protein n=1 Tax=Kistimonas scapharcae TaxID=1036133 RepID=A0ABP8V7M0_9GAMM